jgi:alpha-N-arabinofuranosidase
LKAVNSFERSTNVSPQDERITVKGKNLALTLKPYSFNIVRLQLK